ncbi:hypothetical protein C8F04DRAFT_1276751 [Mycena alexandri]|uniref:Uncharacterized protein n=1 Tax=Mycena alexandri TaxID=1745969 RepID=A0AAD6S4Z3_9AGAR|nr:hypothetical protein C8F04DRAFT_1276751 [Mycena alexandri]
MRQACCHPPLTGAVKLPFAFLFSTSTFSARSSPSTPFLLSPFSRGPFVVRAHFSFLLPLRVEAFRSAFTCCLGVSAPSSMTPPLSTLPLWVYAPRDITSFFRRGCFVLGPPSVFAFDELHLLLSVFEHTTFVAGAGSSFVVHAFALRRLGQFVRCCASFFCFLLYHFLALPSPTATTNRRRHTGISAPRASTVDPTPGASHATANSTNSDAAEEQLVEDKSMQYVLIEDDIFLHTNTQRKLRAYTATWWGVLVLSPAPAETSSSPRCPACTSLAARNPPAPHLHVSSTLPPLPRPAPSWRSTPPSSHRPLRTSLSAQSLN